MNKLSTMNRNQLAGFGFILLGLLQLVPIVTADNVGSIEMYGLLMGIGGLALAGMGTRVMWQREESEAQSNLVGVMNVLAVISIFIGFMYALSG